MDFKAYHCYSSVTVCSAFQVQCIYSRNLIVKNINYLPVFFHYNWKFFVYHFDSAPVVPARQELPKILLYKGAFNLLFQKSENLYKSLRRHMTNCVLHC